jgi:hypothetical protein
MSYGIGGQNISTSFRFSLVQFSPNHRGCPMTIYSTLLSIFPISSQVIDVLCIHLSSGLPSSESMLLDLFAIDLPCDFWDTLLFSYEQYAYQV